jgi:hypothetical protein
LKYFLHVKIEIQSWSDIRTNPVIETSILAVTGHAVAIR